MCLSTCLSLQAATISLVVPAVLSLYSGLIEAISSPDIQYLRRLATTLRDSLMSRFQGIFMRASMAHGMEKERAPFYNKVYVVAATLDPNIKLQWVEEIVSGDIDEVVEETGTQRIKQETQGKTSLF